MGRGSLVRKGGGLESHWCCTSGVQISPPAFLSLFSSVNSSSKSHIRSLYHFEDTRRSEERFMCIAVPAEVIEIRDGNIGLVDFGDLQHEVRLDLVDVQVGEFVLVHVGFAIQRLSREEGLETREIFRQVYEAMGA